MPTVPVPSKPIPPQDQYAVETINSGITGTNSEELSEASTSIYSQDEFPEAIDNSIYPDKINPKSKVQGTSKYFQSSEPANIPNRSILNHYMWAKQNDALERLAPNTSKKLPKLMATQGIIKYDTIGDKNCAYYSMGGAISDKINSGYKINATPQ